MSRENHLIEPTFRGRLGRPDRTPRGASKHEVADRRAVIRCTTAGGRGSSWAGNSIHDLACASNQQFAIAEAIIAQDGATSAKHGASCANAVRSDAALFTPFEAVHYADEFLDWYNVDYKSMQERGGW